MTQIFRLDNPLLGRGLRLPQRLCYLNAMLHFQFALPRLVFLTAPLAYLLFGLNIIATSPQMIAAYALPHLFHAVYTNSRLVGRFRYSFWGEIYESVLAFHLIKPTLVTLWSPRRGKFNVTEKGGLLEEGYFDGEVMRPHLFVLGLLVAAVLWGAIRLGWNDVFHIQVGVMLLNVLWASVSILVLLASIAVAREVRQLRRSVRVSARLPVIVHLASGHALSARTVNLSMGGALLEGLGRSSLPSEVECLEITFDQRGLMFPVKSVDVADDDETLRFRFADLPLRQRRELVGVVMGRADAWIPDKPHPQDRPLRSLWQVLRSVVGLFFHQWQEKGLRFRRPVSRQKSGRLTRGWLAPVMLVAVVVLGVLMVSHRIWAQVPDTSSAYAPSAADESRQAPGAHESGANDPPGELPPLRFGNDGRLDLDTADLSLRSASREVKVDLLPGNSPLRLSARSLLSGVSFSTRSDEVVTAATMELELSHSASGLSSDSRLGVFLNGEQVQVITLDQFNAEGVTQRFSLPSALILPYNTMDFRLLGLTERMCRAAQEESGWIDIASSTHLKLTVQRLPRPNDLGRLPAPFVDAGGAGGNEVAMVFPHSPSDGQIRAAAMAASRFGSLVENSRFPVEFDSLPENNALLFGLSGRRLAGIQLPEVQGPTLVMRDNPLNPLFKLLLVVGRDEAELVEAARALALSGGLDESLKAGGSGPLAGAAETSPQGSRATFEPVSVEPRLPYDAPRWIDEHAQTTLAALMKGEGFIARGLYPQVHRLDFRVAPDLFLWPGQNYSLKLNYRFPRVDWLDPLASQLDVSLNGEYLDGLPVVSGKALDRLWQALAGTTRNQSAEVLLPRDLLYGNNRLRFYFNLAVAEGVECSPSLGEEAISRILSSSFIDLDRSEHFTTLPSLSLFVSAGFPFSRLADLGDSVALLPQSPSAVELEALFASVGRIGAATGYPATRLKVRQGLNNTADLAGKHLLAVADLEDLADSDLLKAGPFEVASGRLGVGDVPWLERWRYWLLGDWRPIWHKARAGLEDAGAFRGLVSAPSPVDRSRFLVAVVAADDADLPEVVRRLRQPEVGATVQGDVALVPPDGPAKSYRAGPRYGVGSMPWHMVLRWYLGQNLIAMSIVLLLLVALIGATAYGWLASRAEQRLARKKEDAND